MERKCKVCGKKIYLPVPEMWAYKTEKLKGGRTFHYFCSWKCLREAERKKRPKKVIA